MKLKEIHRTSTFAWSPAAAVPLLATGTVAGALDESFSNDSRLEIWTPNFLDRDEYDLGGEGHAPPTHALTTASRFNRLAWGAIDPSRPNGVLAAGMENGELALWDPDTIVAQPDTVDATIHKTKAHDGPVRGLDFNPIAKNLLASGAINGQIFVWDLKDPSSPYSPGGRSSRLDEITALAWNSGVQQILATSSSTGYTVVWDLRGKREVVALSYSTGGGPMQSSRRGQSAVAWHPDNSTRLVTASEDDSSPIIMLWDLRNARAPEKTLNGHDKGILSTSWCKQDADLLLSCGKDARTIVWNPQTGEAIGELPAASNWAYQVEWCPRDPSILATASFDGAIGIHSIQSTNQEEAAATPSRSATDDVFAPSYHQNFDTTLSLKQPPKWLKRPVGGSFGYGGHFVTISNLPGASGQHQSGVIHIRPLATEKSIINRAKALADASKDSSSLNDFAAQNAKDATNAEEASWKALSSLFNAGSRDELITLLGFSKDKIATRVAEAIQNLQGTPVAPSRVLPSVESSEPDTPIAEKTTEEEVTPKSEAEEVSVSEPASSSSSLFGDVAGTPHAEAEADFFSSMGPIASSLPSHMQVPHVDSKGESSAAATQGSRSPSIAPSEIGRGNTFRIYPEGESNVDRLVTQALVLGDFSSAVDLCLSAQRYADALLIAVKGGPELLKKTQNAYFESSTVALPYLRLYQSIVGNDLVDVVQNADLREWQEVFVVLCTYATQEEFPILTEQLGMRLEFQGTLIKSSCSGDADSKARTLRRHATLCYLAAGNLEKVLKIWLEEMQEEQDAYAANVDQAPLNASMYTAHAQALQTFIEKVTIFRSAVKYRDVDLETSNSSEKPAEAGVRSYKLANLYDRYIEYADLLATQGLLDLALNYVLLTPKDYSGGDSKDSPIHFGRERLLIAAGKQAPTARAETVTPTVQTKSFAPAVPSKGPGTTRATQPGFAKPMYPSAAPAPALAPVPPVPAPVTASPYTPANYAGTLSNSYAPPSFNTYGSPPTNSMVPPPPSAVGSTPVPPPPKSTQKPAGIMPGWNDAPLKSVPSHTSTPPISHAYSAYTSNQSQQRPPSIPPPPPASSSTVPPPPKAGTAPPPSTLVSSHPHFGQTSRPNSVANLRPTSTGPGPYAPQPLANPAGAGGVDYSRSTSQPGGVPPPMGGRYAPPPGSVPADPSIPSGPKVPPPPRAGTGGAVPPPPRASGAGPGAPPSAAARSTPSPAPSPAAAPPKASPHKYPPGDRSHIPDSVKGLYHVLSEALENFKKVTPARMSSDVEKRMNVLFDSLNNATLAIPVVRRLLQIADAFQEKNQGAALQIHLEMLTEGGGDGDDIGRWMPALKQLIQKMHG